ncbi:MAG TPA: OsmC family protein [Fimbriimonadales bacterium]|nr:OsmC family protein [Fimbriimonadales bacterium]
MKAQLEWKGGMVFYAYPPSGYEIHFDAHPDFGGQGKGSQPMETLLCAVAACTAMDVISILQKKKQKITSYRLEITGERPPENTYPRPFTKVKIRHILEGPEIAEEAVQRAVQLSDEKYCGASATLRHQTEVTAEWVVNPPTP